MLRTYILMCFISLFSFLCACNDIVDSDKNIIIIPIGDSQTLKTNIEFYFSNDLLTYHNNDTTVIWTTFQNVAWSRSFGIINRSKDSVLQIKNVSLQDNSNFSLSLSKNFPIDLEPDNIFTKMYISINLDNQNIPKGLYNNRIIINDNEDIGFTFRVKIN